MGTENKVKKDLAKREKSKVHSSVNMSNTNIKITNVNIKITSNSQQKSSGIRMFVTVDKEGE